ncbi:MAG TPA: agmatine deiminase family protein [Cyclobacteriaceae bacterium]|nr:agmatine deiminase family protein [Cyclobacteriaceae bacterium]
MVKINISILLILTLLASCKSTDQKEPNLENRYLEINKVRTAAEWEPALGTMIVWPLGIPYKLVVELAKEGKLFILVENENTKAEAQRWLTQWGVDSQQVEFIYAPQGIDAWWVRDWGPSAVFYQDDVMKLADGKYIYSTPISGLACDDSLRFLYTNAKHQIELTDTDDQASQKFAEALHYKMVALPFVNTGGNVLTDGAGTAFSTCVLLNENRYDGTDEQEFIKHNAELLGLNNYHVISNFEEMGIQHIDCFMKILDPERILVARPPADHVLYPIYENIVANELEKLVTPYGRPYNILRLDTYRYQGEDLAAYTNAIIINKSVFVPLFNIPGDSMALKQWREAMPGYEVKGFTYSLAGEPVLDPKVKQHYKNYGWDEGDALHCRTRAVWDDKMLYLSMRSIDSREGTTDGYPAYITINDYSRVGLVENEQKIFWRIKGQSTWNEVLLKEEMHTHFTGSIPHAPKGETIEYYVSASSKSGRTETVPRTAPNGFYFFTAE